MDKTVFLILICDLIRKYWQFHTTIKVFLLTLNESQIILKESHIIFNESHATYKESDTIYKVLYRISKVKMLPVGDESPVFHSSYIKIWKGHHVLFRQRERYAEIIFKESQRLRSNIKSIFGLIKSFLTSPYWKTVKRNRSLDLFSIDQVWQKWWSHFMVRFVMRFRYRVRYFCQM